MNVFEWFFNLFTPETTPKIVLRKYTIDEILVIGFLEYENKEEIKALVGEGVTLPEIMKWDRRDREQIIYRLLSFKAKCHYEAEEADSDLRNSNNPEHVDISEARTVIHTLFDYCKDLVSREEAERAIKKLREIRHKPYFLKCYTEPITLNEKWWEIRRQMQQDALLRVGYEYDNETKRV